jgi:hypothetical protein
MKKKTIQPTRTGLSRRLRSYHQKDDYDWQRGLVYRPPLRTFNYISNPSEGPIVAQKGFLVWSSNLDLEIAGTLGLKTSKRTIHSVFNLWMWMQISQACAMRTISLFVWCGKFTLTWDINRIHKTHRYTGEVQSETWNNATHPHWRDPYKFENKIVFWNSD